MVENDPQGATAADAQANKPPAFLQVRAQLTLLTISAPAGFEPALTVPPETIPVIGRHLSGKRARRSHPAPHGTLPGQTRRPRHWAAPRASRVPSTLSSFRASARGLSPSGIVAILLPAFVTRLVGTVGGDAACASPARARRVKARRAPPPRPAQDSSRGCPISLGRPRPRTRSA
jgi:hypothetical protein